MGRGANQAEVLGAQGPIREVVEMKFESKYNFGDVVYPIRQKVLKTWELCPFCEGEKWIIGKNGQKKLCPDCSGLAGR